MGSLSRMTFFHAFSKPSNTPLNQELHGSPLDHSTQSKVGLKSVYLL